MSKPRNIVREKLGRDEVVASMIVRLVEAPAIATLAAHCGFDTLYVDLEHSPLSLQTTSAICTAALTAGITPFVRVPAVGPEFVSRALDGGALGIIAPHIESAAAAKAVVDLCRYPPLGKRSPGGPLPHFGYRNPKASEAFGALNEATTVVVMIESGAAVERLDEIAAVPGVDILLIGSNDLSSDLGIPDDLGHPRVREAIEKTVAACRRHGKHAGIGGLGSRPDLVSEAVAKGVRYVSIGADLTFLMSSAIEAARFVRELAPNG